MAFYSVYHNQEEDGITYLVKYTNDVGQVCANNSKRHRLPSSDFIILYSSKDQIPKRKFYIFLISLFLKTLICNVGFTSGQPLHRFDVLKHNLCSLFMTLNTDICNSKFIDSIFIINRSQRSRTLMYTNLHFEKVTGIYLNQ